MSRLSFANSKIVSSDEAYLVINSWKLKENSIVFTNGCFDILHKGHITYLAKAADLGSKLVIGINSDDSVKRLNKDANRPINDEAARSLLIAALGFVDLVVLFHEDTPLQLIQNLKPNILVKGADYDPNQTDPNQKDYIVGSDFIRQNGGEVKVIDLEEGFSTTSIIQKLRN